MTPYYMEPNRTDAMRARMDEYGEICRRLAEKYDCIFIDTQAMFDEYFKYQHSAYIAWDRVHPNQIGATLMAKEFLKQCDFDYSR
jgi:lysophospholipase L1-like esterase